MDALLGNPQDLCCLLHTQPAEKAKFDDSCLAPVPGGERVQGIVDGDQPRLRYSRRQSVVKGNLERAASAPACFPRAQPPPGCGA